MSEKSIDLTNADTSFQPGKPACINCSWWQVYTIKPAIQATDMGECRLHPPSAHLTMVKAQQQERARVDLSLAAPAAQRDLPDQPAIVPGRIRTRADDWCSHHPALEQARVSQMAQHVAVSIVHMFKQARIAWDSGAPLRDTDGKFLRVPTLDEARSFAGQRGEPAYTADPVSPVPGAAPMEDNSTMPGLQKP